MLSNSRLWIILLRSSFFISDILTSWSNVFVSLIIRSVSFLKDSSLIFIWFILSSCLNASLGLSTLNWISIILLSFKYFPKIPLNFIGVSLQNSTILFNFVCNLCLLYSLSISPDLSNELKNRPIVYPNKPANKFFFILLPKL